MNKRDYLDLLRYYLRDLPGVMVNDIIYDYEEHFNAGIENGKTEEQISEELGSPDDIAKEYLNFSSHRKRREYNKTSEEDVNINFDDELEEKKIDWIKWGAIIILGIILFPVVLSLFIGFISLLFGIFMGIMGLTVGLIATGIALLASLFIPFGTFEFISIPFFLYDLNPITRISGTIFIMAVGIFMFRLAIIFIKWMIKTIKDIIISIRWKIGRSR